MTLPLDLYIVFIFTMTFDIVIPFVDLYFDKVDIGQAFTIVDTMTLTFDMSISSDYNT